MSRANRPQVLDPSGPLPRIFVSAHVCSSGRGEHPGACAPCPTSSSVLSADTTLQGESPGMLPSTTLRLYVCLSLKEQKNAVVGPKLAPEDAVISQPQLTWRVSLCHLLSPWDWQRGQRQPKRWAAFSGATLPTYFCWQPPNPASASVSHWPSPKPKIKQKQVGERGTGVTAMIF